MKIPIDPKDRKAFASFSGRTRANILDPSNGGMGIRLKIARRRLRRTMFSSIKSEELGIIFKMRLAAIAIKTLVRGPAKETSAMSFLPSLKLKGSTGTGFAAPIIMGEPEIKRIRGRAMLIIGSICFLGSRVSLPARRAVGSPSRSATNPCAISCKIAEKIKITRVIMADMISII